MSHHAFHDNLLPHFLSRFLLFSCNLLPLNHGHLPLCSGNFVQVKCGNCVLYRTMTPSPVLNLLLQLLPRQITQFSWHQHLLLGGKINMVLHVRRIGSSISGICPRMVNSKRLQIILKRMPNQNFPTKQGHDSLATLLQGHSRRSLIDIFFGNARHKCAVVSDRNRHLDKGIQHNFLLPIDHGDACDGRVKAFRSHAHHFAIERKVNIAFAHGGIVDGARVFIAEHCARLG
mmetsp:Transcript_21999/g.32390  ORF Transcript_21999/g.32390 Transcript_21999/m.32390 type:complete len:231 (-) Transcript_21999:543-1235(-)